MQQQPPEEAVKFDIDTDVVVTTQPSRWILPETLLRIESVRAKEPELVSVWTVLESRCEEP